MAGIQLFEANVLGTGFLCGLRKDKSRNTTRLYLLITIDIT